MPTRISVFLSATAAAVVLALVMPAAQGGGGRGGGQAPAGGGAAGRGAPPGGGPGGRGGPARDATNQTALGTGVISGSVAVEGTGTAVRRARVTLTGTELRASRSTLTDEQGRFNFSALPAGRFTMTASKAGYVDNTYGAKRAGRPGTQIQLAEGQSLERAVINLPRGGVITGVVVDEHGEPSPGTQVRALRYVIRTGEKTLQQAGQDTTDDRGVYRIFQLQPGDYIVNALPRNMTASDLQQSIASEISSVMQQLQVGGGGGGRGGNLDLTQLATLAAGRGAALGDRLATLQQQLSSASSEPSTAYAPVYYPGTTVPTAAATVSLNVSEERANVDFQLQLLATSRVTGLVVNPAGTLPQGTQVGLVPADRGSMPSIPGLGNAVTRVGADGRFTFNNVTPGPYLVQARATLRQATPAPDAGAAAPAGGGGGGRGGPGGAGQGAITEVLWASSPIEVGAATLPDTVLNLQPGMTVAGRVVFEGATTGAQAPDPTRTRVTLSTRGQQMFEIGGGPAAAPVDASGRFSIVGVSPGRYTISAGAAGAARGAGPAGGAAGVAGGGRGGGAAPGQANTAWQLKSAVADGRDLLDFPIDLGPNQSLSNVTLTFTNVSQDLSGTIQDGAGRPTSDFTIIVFAADSRYWLPQSRRITATRPGTDGRFTFRGLPAGDYRLTAVTDVEPGEWYDTAFLTQMAAVSIPVALAEGEKKVQDIRLANGQ